MHWDIATGCNQMLWRDHQAHFVCKGLRESGRRCMRRVVFRLSLGHKSRARLIECERPQSRDVPERALSFAAGRHLSANPATPLHQYRRSVAALYLAREQSAALHVAQHFLRGLSFTVWHFWFSNCQRRRLLNLLSKSMVAALKRELCFDPPPRRRISAEYLMFQTSSHGFWQ